MNPKTENNPKRQKIEEDSAIAFWTWYLPNSRHPKTPYSEVQQTHFRFDSAYRLYCKLVRRKWHLRWYMMFILDMDRYLVMDYESLRVSGAFREHVIPTHTPEYWE